MNILFVVPYVPSLIRVRPYNLIRYLANRGHHITVVTLSTKDEEEGDLEKVRQICREVISLPMPVWRSLMNCALALPTGKPLQTVYSWNPALAGRARELAWCGNGHPEFDVIHVEHLRGVRYASYLKSQMRDGHQPMPIIWDSVDSISLLFRQAMVQSKSAFSRGLTRLELSRTERYEALAVNEFDGVLVTSPADRQALLDLARGEGESAHVTVLRNGVDLEYFKPNPSISRAPASVVITGKMSYHANETMAVNFVDQIMPVVWRKRPEVQVKIVGKDPAPRVKALAHDPRVEVTGTMKDIRPYLWKGSLAAAPLAYGVGIQNKVLEAMACGTPVVSSRQAVSALQAVPGREVMVADGAGQFAENILNLLDDPEAAARLGSAGRAYVEREHDWSGVAEKLERIYDQVIRARSGTIQAN